MAAKKKASTKKSASRKATSRKTASKKAASKKSTSKKSTSKKSSGRLDAIALLKQDHEEVLSLLESLEEATGARRQKLLGQIEQELKVHTTIEEEIFYPAFQAAARKKEDQKMFYEAVHEHHVVDQFLPEARDGVSNEELKAKAKVLKELVEHHAEEEEDEMFPRARKVLGREELRELGRQMQERKTALMAGMPSKPNSRASRR
jgi:hemerythrin-like domain-containing protein